MQIENRRAVITICLGSPVDKGVASTFVGKGLRRKKKDNYDYYYYYYYYDDDDDDDALSLWFSFFAFFCCLYEIKSQYDFSSSKMIYRSSIVKRRRQETFLICVFDIVVS